MSYYYPFDLQTEDSRIEDASIIFKDYDEKGKLMFLIEIDLHRLKVIPEFKNKAKEELWEIAKILTKAIYRCTNNNKQI